MRGWPAGWPRRTSLDFFSLHTVFQHPRLLPSRTEGIEFEAMIEVRWSPRSRHDPGLLDAMKADVVRVASDASRKCPAHDVQTAENVVNAELAAWGTTGAPGYRRISPRAALNLSTEAAETLARRHADEERVRRLSFLKDHLYSDPALVVLERLERHPDQSSDQLLEDFLRASRLIRSSDEWWSPLLVGAEALAERFGEDELAYRLMQALTDAVTEVVKQQALPHQPPTASSTDSHSTVTQLLPARTGDGKAQG